MKAIRENLIGLLRFIRLMFSVLIFARKLKEEEAPQEKDKYGNILGQPSEPLIGLETKFCSKCHVAVCQYRHTQDGLLEIIQHGNRISVGNVKVVAGNRKIQGFPIRCPNGHEVVISWTQD